MLPKGQINLEKVAAQCFGAFTNSKNLLSLSMHLCTLYTTHITGTDEEISESMIYESCPEASTNSRE